MSSASTSSILRSNTTPVVVCSPHPRDLTFPKKSSHFRACCTSIDNKRRGQTPPFLSISIEDTTYCVNLWLPTRCCVRCSPLSRRPRQRTRAQSAPFATSPARNSPPSVDRCTGSADRSGHPTSVHYRSSHRAVGCTTSPAPPILVAHLPGLPVCRTDERREMYRMRPDTSCPIRALTPRITAKRHI